MDQPEETSSQEDKCQSDDLPKLENKVLYALSRLQKDENSFRNQRKRSGVSTQEIVEYFMENYHYLDGDVESQVITALLSCIKIGFVCIQDNGKFRLLGANPRMMTSYCLTRSIHSPQCSCAALLNGGSKIQPSNCCSLQMNLKKSPKMILKRTPAYASKSKSKTKSPLKFESEANQNSKKSKKKFGKAKCVQKVTKRLCEPELSRIEDVTAVKKCSYCLRNHGSTDLSLKMCKKCYPRGINLFVPADKFSPREDIM